MNPNFILNPSFYANNLVVVPDTEKADFEVSGSNHRHILVVYCKSAISFDRETLEKILAALSLDINKDIALIGITETQKFCFSDWSKVLQPKYMISFGKPMNELGLQLNNRPYEITKTSDCQFLMVDDLHVLTDPANKAKKIAFWNCLQELFPKKNEDV